MFETVILILGWLILAASCSFALWKGGAPERSAALLALSSWLIAYLISYILPGQESHRWELAFVAVDGFFAAGLLVLAILYAKAWLGAAMLLQSAALALHGIVMADWGFGYREYMAFNNGVSFAILFLLAAATGFAWRDRSLRARRANLEDPKPVTESRPGWAAAPKPPRALNGAG